jgi:hypothetical protein
MGFTPVQNPALVVVVTLNGTSGDAGFGGAAAGPVFNVVTAEALRLLDIPKSEAEEPVKELKAKKVDPKIAGDVTIADLEDDEPNILEDEDAPSQPKLVEAKGGLLVPNFRGKTDREVMSLASETGVPVIIAGSGTVNYQMPLAGEVLLPGQKVKVKLAR